MPKTLIRDLSLLFLLAMMWSSSFTAVKVGANEVPPATFAMLRVAVGALVLLVWVKLRGIQMPRELRLWGSFFLIGLFGNAIPFVLINWGEQKIASGLAAIIIASMPLAALLLGRFFSDEILNLRRGVGVTLGFVGVVILIGPQELLALGEHAVRQVAVGGAALCYAIASILIRKLPVARPSAHGVGVLIASTLILLPVSLIWDQPWALDYSVPALAATVYLGVFPTALATICLIIVIASRGVTFLALNNYLIPVLGVLWGFLFLDEPVTQAIVTALALILVGIAIAGSGPATRQDVKPAPEKVQP